MSLIARGLEARGLPTIFCGVLEDVADAYKPPRAVHIDFPAGCSAGRPNRPDQQRDILRAIFKEAPTFDQETEWRQHMLPFQWSPEDGDRSWEDKVVELLRGGMATVTAHIADNQARGESLSGREKEFTIRCNC